MRKIFTLTIAVLASFSLMADDFVLGASSFASDKLSATVDGQTFAFSLAHGGGGNDSYFSGGAQYIKINAGKTVTITFPYGFAATKINIKGYTNKDSESNGSIAKYGEDDVTGKTFPARKTTDIADHECITTGYDFSIASGAASVSFTTGSGNQVCLLITISGTPASCTPPTIAWGSEPQGGKVGDPDFEATANSTPAQTIAWTSSNPEVATVTNGTIHYVASGITTITASLTYSGTEYCPMTVSVSKSIAVYLDPIVPATNDRVWYFPTELPDETTGSGLNYAATNSSNGLFGIKLNSEGYAWFAKPAVAGKLRVGAYYKDANTAAYEVNVFACDETGTKGEALGTLSVAAAGQASSQLAIAAAVERIRIERKTGSEGILYFIEFQEGGGETALDNTSVDGTVTKTFENGQLIIIKNGVKYNATGAIVK